MRDTNDGRKGFTIGGLKEYCEDHRLRYGANQDRGVSITYAAVALVRRYSTHLSSLLRDAPSDHLPPRTQSQADGTPILR